MTKMSVTLVPNNVFKIVKELVYLQLRFPFIELANRLFSFFKFHFFP